MKITLFLSTPENSGGQSETSMSLETAQNIVNFAFEQNSDEKKIEFEFSGGEPLLRLETIKTIANVIISHPLYNSFDVRMTVVSNGTVYNDKVIALINRYNMAYKVNIGIIPAVAECEDGYRYESFADAQVEENIRQALENLPVVLVSAVFSSSSFRYLPQCVRYFSELGVRHQFYYPDYSDAWSIEDLEALQETFEELTTLYLNFHKFDNPHYINLIDEKIPLVLNGGYRASGRFSTEKQRYVFSPQGVLFPDERLVGDGEINEHALGYVNDNSVGISIKPESQIYYNNEACFDCGVADYCKNCTGMISCIHANEKGTVNNIDCISEKAAIESAMNVLTFLDALDPFTFIEHYNGSALLQL